MSLNKCMFDSIVNWFLAVSQQRKEYKGRSKVKTTSPKYATSFTTNTINTSSEMKKTCVSPVLKFHLSCKFVKIRQEK